MRFQTGHAQRRLAGDTARTGTKRRAAGLIRRPAFGCRLVDQRLIARQLFMIAHENIPALFLGQKSYEFLICFGKEPSHVMQEPVDLGTRAKKNPPQHQPGHPLGMRNGVCKGECASPGPAKQQPFFDPEMDTKRLDVGNQVLGRVLRGFAVRGGPATATLVEQHAMEPVRIEKPPVGCRDARAGPSMKKQHRPAIGAPNLFEIDVMQATVQLAAAEGRLHRKQFFFLNESVCHAHTLAQKDGA